MTGEQSPNTFWTRWRSKIGDFAVLLIFVGVTTLVTMSWNQGEEINTLTANQKNAVVIRAMRSTSINDQVDQIRAVNKNQSNKLNNLDQRVNKNDQAIGVLKNRVQHVEQALKQRSP